MQPRPWLRDFVDRFTVTGTYAEFVIMLSSASVGDIVTEAY